MAASDEPSWTEEDYASYLETERHLYAWALQRYGDFSEADALSDAEARYPHEPPSAEFRGHIFHWTSWFLAMEKIHGEFFYVDRPELEEESEEFQAEAARVLRPTVR